MRAREEKKGETSRKQERREAPTEKFSAFRFLIKAVLAPIRPHRDLEPVADKGVFTGTAQNLFENFLVRRFH